MKKIVLSRKVDIVRRKLFDDMAMRNNISFSFFDAYTPNLLPNYAQGGVLTPGERACAYSHVSIMKEFLLSDNKQLMILEDDAYTDSYDKLLEHDLEILLGKYDVVILGYSKVSVGEKSKIQFFRPLYHLNEGLSLCVGLPYKQWKCGTVAYAVSRVGAEKIIKFNEKALYTADDWITFEGLGLTIVHAMPIIFLENMEYCESTLESERKSNVRRHLFLRYFAGAIRHLFLLRFFMKY